MNYAIFSAAAIGSSLLLAAVNFWSVHKKWPARKLWKAAGYISPSDLEKSYNRYVSIESWTTLGLILSFSACYGLASLSSAHLLQPPSDFAIVVRIAPALTMVLLVACYIRNRFSQTF